MNDILIAIDPGKNGGLAWRTSTGVHIEPMPATVHDLVILISRIVGPFGAGDCIIERVHSMPHDSGKAAFSFGENFGMIQGVLASYGVSYRFVTPQQWQKKLGTLPADKADRKHAIRALMQQRYPQLIKKITLKTADALAMLDVQFNNEKTHNAKEM
jgi:hypothetical protein